MGYRYVFGPVRSRRLGVSLGVNNIPYKVCSYTCIYCQLGRTIRLSAERRRYSDPEAVAREVAAALEEAGRVDYVSFVPDGEPTLDLSLGEEIERIEADIGARVAVFTNSSLLWRGDVRSELARASYVSLKVDAGSEKTWRAIDRPAPVLGYSLVMDGVRRFAKDHGGAVYLTTETMLVAGVNDSRDELERIADILAELEPRKAYIAAPTRPPAEPWARPPTAEKLVEAHEVFRERGLRAELLAAPEPGPPELVGDDPVEALYRTIAVHPLPLDTARSLLAEKGLNPEEGLQRLLSKSDVVEARFRGRVFLARRPAAGARAAPATRGTS